MAAFFFLLWRTRKKIPKPMRARTATPPTTPPTMGPMGVDDCFFSVGALPLSPLLLPPLPLVGPLPVLPSLPSVLLPSELPVAEGIKLVGIENDPSSVADSVPDSVGVMVNVFHSTASVCPFHVV